MAYHVWVHTAGGGRHAYAAALPTGPDVHTLSLAAGMEIRVHVRAPSGSMVQWVFVSDGPVTRKGRFTSPMDVTIPDLPPGVWTVWATGQLRRDANAGVVTWQPLRARGRVEAGRELTLDFRDPEPTDPASWPEPPIRRHSVPAGPVTLQDRRVGTGAPRR